MSLLRLRQEPVSRPDIDPPLTEPNPSLSFLDPVKLPLGCMSMERPVDRAGRNPNQGSVEGLEQFA
ncbi:MAG: hypothetical protein PHP75_08005 [Methylacidiphilaceae bacterium]|nr:hypothetical protein [Candidatus Methylacidiphilaceae bacterium]